MEMLSLLAVAGIAMGLRSYADLSAGSALLHAAATVIVFLYISSLVGVLFPGTVLLLVAGLVLFALAGARDYRAGATLPVPVILLVLFAIIYWAAHRDASFFYYDEYSHWGVFLRDMLASGALWDSSTNSMHPRNLPGASLFQYFFAIFSNRPEGAAYLAQFVLVLSPLMVLWEKLNFRDVAWIGGIAVLVIVSVSNFGHGFTSIYIDHVLGAWFVGTVLNALYEMDRRPWPQIYTYLIPLSALVLFKSTGFFYVVAVSGIVAFFILLGPVLRVVALPRRLASAAGLPAAAVILSLLIMFAWNANRDAAGIPVPIDTTGEIAGSLLERDSVFSQQEQDEIERRFREVFFKQQISKDEISSQYNAFSYPMMPLYTDRFRLTTFSFLALAAVAMLLQWLYVFPRDRKVLCGMASGLTWLTAVAYIGILFMGYRYIANNDNGLNLSSYIRYSHSMLLPVLIMVFAPLLPAFRSPGDAQLALGEDISVSRTSAVFSALLVLFMFFETPYLQPLVTTQTPPDLRLQTETLTIRIRQKIGDAPLYVFFPNAMTNGFIGQMLQFQLSPGRTVVGEDIRELLEDPQAFGQALADYEYAWFPIQSEEIDLALEPMLRGDVTQRLFRVGLEGDSVTLTSADDIFAD